MPPLDVLVAQFERIAFSNEFGGQHRRGRIVKWATPIRARITGLNADIYERPVAEMLAQLQRLSKLQIDLLQWHDPTEANFTIHFVARPSPGQDPCAAFIDDDERFRITRVRILITGPVPTLRQHCIAEELIQALGLADDSKLIFPSIFHDASRQQGLFPWDEIMLQMLYNPSLHPGITVAEARPIVRRELARLVAALPVTTHSPPPDQPTGSPESPARVEPARRPAQGRTPAAPTGPESDIPAPPRGIRPDGLKLDPSAIR
ncbi:MAG: DUF2927 domain-containing protein [Alphaproteobacteria bacterium]|nr:DUF2927 domain-containing protein [Alphaproteobacteria bacterium]